MCTIYTFDEIITHYFHFHFAAFVQQSGRLSPNHEWDVRGFPFAGIVRSISLRHSVGSKLNVILLSYHFLISHSLSRSLDIIIHPASQMYLFITNDSNDRKGIKLQLLICFISIQWNMYRNHDSSVFLMRFFFRIFCCSIQYLSLVYFDYTILLAFGNWMMTLYNILHIIIIISISDLFDLSFANTFNVAIRFSLINISVCFIARMVVDGE